MSCGKHYQSRVWCGIVQEQAVDLDFFVSSAAENYACAFAAFAASAAAAAAVQIDCIAVGFGGSHNGFCAAVPPIELEDIGFHVSGCAFLHSKEGQQAWGMALMWAQEAGPVLTSLTQDAPDCLM